VQPGALALRFDGPLVFFNAPHFKHEVLTTVGHAEGIRWLVLDMLPVSRLDITGLTVLFELNRSLRALGIQLVLAGRIDNLAQQMQRRGISFESEQIMVCPTLNTAIREYRLTQIAHEVHETPAASKDEPA
jgi:anti-anti-sigma regulatory factor